MDSESAFHASDDNAVVSGQNFIEILSGAAQRAAHIPYTPFGTQMIGALKLILETVKSLNVKIAKLANSMIFQGGGIDFAQLFREKNLGFLFPHGNKNQSSPCLNLVFGVCIHYVNLADLAFAVSETRHSSANFR